MAPKLPISLILRRHIYISAKNLQHEMRCYNIDKPMKRFFYYTKGLLIPRKWVNFGSQTANTTNIHGVCRAFRSPLGGAVRMYRTCFHCWHDMCFYTKPLSTQEVITTYSHHHVTTLSHHPLPACQEIVSPVFCKILPQFFLLSSGCHPLGVITRGSPSPRPSASDANVKFQCYAYFTPQTRTSCLVGVCGVN